MALYRFSLRLLSLARRVGRFRRGPLYRRTIVELSFYPEASMGSYEMSRSDSDASFFVKSYNVDNSNRRCRVEDNLKKNEFGKFQDTRDWVECESMSCPGKMYFFNLRTQCSTWSRPVSQHVQLQRFPRNDKVYHSDFTWDPDNPSMIVSDSEEDYFLPPIAEERESADKDYKKTDILSRLYHGVNIDNFSNDKKCHYSDGSSCTLSEESYYDEDTWYYPPTFKLGEHFLSTTIDFNEKKICKGNEVSEFPKATADFLEIQFHSPDNAVAATERNEASSDDDVSITEKPIIFSTSSEDDDVSKNDFGLRLRKIKSKYLLTEPPSKRRTGGWRKRQTALIKKKLKATKIVCEMYGTKTINYDSIDVKKSTLSGSSASSSPCHANSVTPHVWDNFEIPGIKSGANNLSSESSSSSCSTCTYSSTTSGTSSSSSSSSSITPPVEDKPRRI